MTDRQKGHIEVVCGCMFSGKTEELIRRIRRALYARQKVQVFSHASDTRYGKNVVASHNGMNIEAVPVPAAGEVLKSLAAETNIVAIDEAQFFDREVAEVAQALADRGLRVIVAGLDMDFRGEPFGPMPLLITQADQVDKLSAICVVCGGAATRTQRIVNGAPAKYDDPVILVGAREAYEARCRRCHQVPGRP